MNTKILRNFSYGVYVVTTVSDNRNVGCIANSIMQITSSPATIAVSLNHDNYTNTCVAKGKRFAVSVLSEQSDPGIISTFGFQSSKDANKFEQIDFTMKSELPIISDSCGYLICEVTDTLETSTHTVFLANIIDGDTLLAQPAMSYAYYHNVVKGKSPKNAPTYIPEESAEAPSNTSSEGKWTCTICNYVYDGDTPFEMLPDTYVCPICKASKQAFEKR